MKEQIKINFKKLILHLPRLHFMPIIQSNVKILIKFSEDDAELNEGLGRCKIHM